MASSSPLPTKASPSTQPRLHSTPSTTPTPTEEVPFLPQREAALVSSETSEQPSGLTWAISKMDLAAAFLGFKNFFCAFLLGLLSSVFIVYAAIKLEKAHNHPENQEKEDKISYVYRLVIPQLSTTFFPLLFMNLIFRRSNIRQILFSEDEVSLISENVQERYYSAVKSTWIWIGVGSPVYLVSRVGFEFARPNPCWKSAICIILSWVIGTLIFLAANVLFFLACSFQRIDLDHFMSLMKENKISMETFIDKHSVINKRLEKLGKRFQWLISFQNFSLAFCCFNALVVTFSVRSGDFQHICAHIMDLMFYSLLHLIPTICIMHGARKVTTRAEEISAEVSKWVFYATPEAGQDIEIGPNRDSFSSFNYRLGLAVYAMNNPGGVIMFDWRVDKGLLDTIFFIQLSLITAVLGQVSQYVN